LQECDFAHALCISNRKGYRPTRLVQVTGDGSQLELTESEGLEESPHYIALSYCWGSHSGFSRSYQTTGQNLANRRISFLREELPQALLDAIDMARLLEVPYIWIDSLCIVQDDAQDWNEQASKMCDVFENAYITVAATSARNTAEGFLAHQESHHAKTNSMNHVPYKFGPDYSVHGPIHFRFPHSPNTSASLVESTWNSRGWILQEQVLSTRILYFLDDIMLMDCVSAPIRVEDPGYARAATLRNPWSRRVIADITNSVATEGNPYGDWYSLMGIYAEKKLSFPEDKLPAISGLARKMIQTHGDFYLAGLWEGDFHRGLLWRPKDSSKMTRYAEYIAPTWSWMSICG
ncbi:HET-domain-containing protein, partial [Hyaloscypha variabilis F]